MRPVVSELEQVDEYAKLFGELMREFEPDTLFGQMLVKRLSLLLWREQRLADAETRELVVAENDHFVAEEMGKEISEQAEEEAGAEATLQIIKARGLIVPIERQLLIGRYQTMLTNQIRKTLEDIERERLRFESAVGREPEQKPNAANDAVELSKGPIDN